MHSTCPAMVSVQNNLVFWPPGGGLKLFPIHIPTHTAETHQDLWLCYPWAQCFCFMLSTNSNTGHYRMREHLRRRSCPLNLLYGSIINIIIIKKIRAFKACKTSHRGIPLSLQSCLHYTVWSPRYLWQIRAGNIQYLQHRSTALGTQLDYEPRLCKLCWETKDFQQWLSTV